MNKKIIVSVIVVILVVLAAIVKIQYFSNEEDETKNIKEALKNNTVESGYVKDLINVQYDKMHVFNPYESKEEMEEKLGFKYSNIEESMSEGITNIVFTKDEQVVEYIYGRSEKLGFSLQILSGTYSKEDLDTMEYTMSNISSDIKRYTINTENTEKNYEKFIGKIIKKNGSNLIITPNGNEDIAKSSDMVSISSEYDFKVGDTVLVTYAGPVMETYPVQVSVVEVERYLIDNTISKYTDLNELPERFNINQALKEGYLVNSGLKKQNMKLYTSFMESVKNNIPCTIRIAQSTIEGDTIITEISYTKESKIKINHDSTRDEFSSMEDREIREYKFDNIISYKNESGEYWCAFNGETMSDEKMESNDCYTILKIN